jgi:signal transduction histidine kinase
MNDIQDSRILWNAGWLRTALEATAAFLLSFFLLLLLQPDATLWFLGLFLACLACAAWCALRISLPGGTGRHGLLREVGIFLGVSVLLTAGVCIPVYGLEAAGVVNLGNFKDIDLGLPVFTVFFGLLYSLIRIGIGIPALVRMSTNNPPGVSLFLRASPYRAWLETVLASFVFFFLLIPLLLLDPGTGDVWAYSLVFANVICVAWFAFRTRLPAGAGWKIAFHELALPVTVNAVFYTGICLPILLLGWTARPGMNWFFPPSGGPFFFAFVITVTFILFRAVMWFTHLLRAVRGYFDSGFRKTGIGQDQPRLFNFFRTGLRRALLEAGAGTFILSLAVMLLDPAQNQNPGLEFIPGGFALWCALRMRLSSGTGPRKFVLEAGYSLACGGFLAGAVYAALFIANSSAYQGMLGQLPFEYLLVAGILALAFGAFRAGIFLSFFWRRLQRRSMVLSLTNGILTIVVVGIAFFGCLIIIPLWLMAENPGMDIPPSNILSMIFYRLTLMLIPVLGGLAVVIVLALMLILPPAVLFSFWVARNYTNRITELVRAAGAMRGGNYSIQVPVQGEDEVARLQSDFNTMASDLDRTVRDLQTERDRVAGILQSRRELIAGVSHELRTPVATIRAHLELARRKRSISSLSAELTILEREVIRLQSLINDLFTLSQAEVNKLTLDLKPVDAGEVVRERAAAMAPLAWQPGRVQVTAEAAAGVPQALADRLRLEQSLTNLIHNAARHTPPGGVVVVAVSSEADAVRIDVRDSGEGIAPKDLPQIWDRYYQAKGAAKNQGSGLGLALVKDFIEAMGGSVAVESVAGKGSCFTLRLKRAKE